jgi:hypothetical protein
MKKHSLLKLFSVSLLLVIYSTGCNKTKNEKIITKKSDKDLIKLYSNVGKMHNRGLDHLYTVFKKIADSRQSQRTTDDSIDLLLVNEAAANYFKNSIGCSGCSELNMVPYYFNDTAFRDRSGLFQNSTVVSHYNGVNETPLNSDLAGALLILDSTLRNDLRPTYYEKYDSLIEVKVPTISNETDKAAFITCASVMKNSYQYWNKNSDKWDSLEAQLTGWHKNGQANKSIGDIIKELVWMDGSGALTGLIRGLIIGAGGGSVTIPGIGTVVGAACGGLAGGFVGGVVGSGGSAIHSFIQWLVNW